MLLDHKSLVIQDPEVILEIARKAGHIPVGTFDKDLARLPGAHRL